MRFDIADAAISLTHVSQEALLHDIGAHLSAGQGFALATLNLDHLVKLRRDPAFRRAYLAHDMVVADGNPVVWLSRLARRPTALLPGSDLLLPLCAQAVEQQVPLSLFGATPEALKTAAQRLAAQLPGLKIGALIAPPMGFDPEGEAAQQALAQIRAQGPGLCLIALGAPKQERFAALGRKLAPEIGFASVGAGIEFVSGHQRRAPAWMRALAMEWLWRALSAPRRMVPRYAACAAILSGEAFKAIGLRFSAS